MNEVKERVFLINPISLTPFAVGSFPISFIPHFSYIQEGCNNIIFCYSLFPFSFCLFAPLPFPSVRMTDCEALTLVVQSNGPVGLEAVPCAV